MRSVPHDFIISLAPASIVEILRDNLLQTCAVRLDFGSKGNARANSVDSISTPDFACEK